MKKMILALAIGTLMSPSCFASVCIVSGAYSNSRINKVVCDGDSTAVSADVTAAQDPYTAELDVLLKQGYRIVSSAADEYGDLSTILEK